MCELGGGHGGVVFRCTLFAEAICWRSISKFVEYRGPGEVDGLWNCFLFFPTCIEEGIQFQKKFKSTCFGENWISTDLGELIEVGFSEI